MKLFTQLYDRVLSWSGHRHAPRYLVLLSVAEASFFPIPTDVMLAPMVLKNPEKAWWFAFLATIASVAGGIFGYAIGYWGLELITPTLQSLGWIEKLSMLQEKFNEFGVLYIFVAGFSPVPFKLFTIAAGVSSLTFPGFVFAAIVGRGARYFLVAGLISRGGEAMAHKLRHYVEWIGWAVVICVILLVVILKH